jgi:hypothetical protein
VTVTNGLFNFSMQYCTDADLTGDPIYLGIKVGTDDEMTPRTAINPVPYARRAENLMAGATIQGANSYLFIPGTELAKDKSADSTTWDMVYAAARITRGATAGNKYVYFPVTIPAVLYGQAVTVSNITVYYVCETATNYIDTVDVYKMTDADSEVSIATETADHKSTTATSFGVDLNPPDNVLSSTQGFLTVRMYLHLENNTDYIQIAGIRLTLDHTP